MNERIHRDTGPIVSLRNSIRWKLVVAMAGMIVAIVSSLTLLQVRSQKIAMEKHLSMQSSFLEEQMNKKADKLSEAMTRHLQRLIITKRLSEVNQYIKDFVRDIEDLRYVILMKGKKPLVAFGINLSRELRMTILSGHVAEFALQQVNPTKHDFELEGLSFREAVVPIEVDEKHWGVLRLGFPLDELKKTMAESQAAIDEELKRVVIHATVTAILFIILGALAVFFLASKWTQRIQELVRFSHELAGGNFSATPHLSTRTNDEIGVLVSSLEEMAESLRRSYAQLEDYSHTLEDKVEKRTRELAEARDKALAATRAKSEFLANMSHEIRTPMNAIIGLTHLALEHESNPQKQRDYLLKIHSAAKSLLGIINDILDVSKIEAGKMDIEMVEFELKEVMSNLSSVSREEAEKKGLKLKIHYPDELPVLIGDPLRLGQILLNLTINAIKFTDKGEINVETEVLEQNSNMVHLRFSVTDTGIGISEDQMEKLFQAFTQADTSTTRKYGGTGLGLTISKQLVELMGGRIEVQSTPGVGSCFSFSIRFATARRHSESALIAPEEIRGLRAIIADPNVGSRNILEKYLKRFDMEVLPVASASELISALRKAPKKKPFDLVLIDWELPDMNGMEAASRIMELDPEQAPKQILVTSYGREELGVEAEAAGMDGFLVKPVSPSRLLESIQKAFHIEKDLTYARDLHKKISPEYLTHLRGAHLLVAEDNEINRQVAEGLLTRAGITMRFATNGQEAVSAIREEAFDGVLMDMQMPVMGGLEATRKIREDKRFRDIPIIAMTANAMEGDRERCLRAGMNDYIAKPIDPEKMYATLSRWIRPSRKKGAGAEPEGKAVPQKNEVSLADIEGIDMEKGLKTLAGDKEQYTKILRKFLDSQSQAVSQLKQALKDGDRERAQQLAHSLKGMAGNIGAMTIYEISGRIEQEIRAGKHVDTALLDHLDEAFTLVINGLKKCFGSKPEPRKEDVSLDPVMIRNLIKQLRESLEDYDSHAVSLMEELKASLADSMISREIRVLQSHLDAYDFESALKALEHVEKALDPHLKNGRGLSTRHEPKDAE